MNLFRKSYDFWVKLLNRKDGAFAGVKMEMNEIDRIAADGDDDVSIEKPHEVYIYDAKNDLYMDSSLADNGGTKLIDFVASAAAVSDDIAYASGDDFAAAAAADDYDKDDNDNDDDDIFDEDDECTLDTFVTVKPVGKASIFKPVGKIHLLRSTQM